MLCSIQNLQKLRRYGEGDVDIYEGSTVKIAVEDLDNGSHTKLVHSPYI